MELNQAAKRFIARIAGDSPGTRIPADLIADFAWSERSSSARSSQWKAWCGFCRNEDRTVFPATAAHIIALIGWLRLERERDTRSARHASFTQYLSAVRQMKLVLTGTPIPPYPFFSHVLRAYRNWEEENFPHGEVRFGVPVTYAQRIWALGMQSASAIEVRNFFACTFAYFFNGLRESSVISLRTLDVSLDEKVVTARLSIVKGRSTSREQLVSYHRWASLTSPLDLLHRWKQVRGMRRRFFAIVGELLDWISGSVHDALTSVLARLDVQAPAQRKFTSPSLRICAYRTHFVRYSGRGSSLAV